MFHKVEFSVTNLSRPAERVVAFYNKRGTAERQARCVCMTRKLTEWPFENGQTEKVGPSDGCRGNAVSLAAESKYDFREPGAYLGKVGLIEPRYASDTIPSGRSRAGCEAIEAMEFTL